MALEGTLQDFSLADIFQLIGLQRKTGILTLTGKEDTVSILFDTGRIVGAESETRHLEDRLGHVLVKTGKLQLAELKRILRVQKETGQRIGTLLLKEKAITREDLVRALQLQVTTILFRLFRWSDGHYHFGQSAEIDYDRECFEPIPVEDILMEALRILDEWPLIEKRVKSFNLVYAHADAGHQVESDNRAVDDEVTDTMDFLLGVENEDTTVTEVEPAGGEPEEEAAATERVTVSPQEAIVYQLVNGRHSVQDVIDRSDLGEFETCKALFQLLEKDLLVEATNAADADAPARRRLTAQGDRAIASGLAVVLAGIAILSSWGGAVVDRRGAAIRAMAPFVPADGLTRLHLAASQNRLARLGYALRIHALHRGYYADSLVELVSVGLVAESDLRDPWGRGYVYVLSRRSFQIRGTDGAGEAHPDLILTGRIRGPAPAAPQQSRLHP